MWTDAKWRENRDLTGNCTHISVTVGFDVTDTAEFEYAISFHRLAILRNPSTEIWSSVFLASYNRKHCKRTRFPFVPDITLHLQVEKQQKIMLAFQLWDEIFSLKETHQKMRRRLGYNISQIQPGICKISIYFSLNTPILWQNFRVFFLPNLIVSSKLFT